MNNEKDIWINKLILARWNILSLIYWKFHSIFSPFNFWQISNSMTFSPSSNRLIFHFYTPGTLCVCLNFPKQAAKITQRNYVNSNKTSSIWCWQFLMVPMLIFILQPSTNKWKYFDNEKTFSSCRFFFQLGKIMRNASKTIIILCDEFPLRGSNSNICVKNKDCWKVFRFTLKSCGHKFRKFSSLNCPENFNFPKISIIRVERQQKRVFFIQKEMENTDKTQLKPSAWAGGTSKKKQFIKRKKNQLPFALLT